MTLMKDKLQEAIEAKNNDIKTFIWKTAKKQDGTQDIINLADATEEQLNKFYKHCQSMLYSRDNINPGRVVLMDIIKEQRNKCNVELFLRKLESGEICANKKEYPRYLYLQDVRSYIDAHKEDFPSNELDTITIASCTGGLPREFERININDVLDGCLDNLGIFNNKHITFNFILSLGICLTPAELKEMEEKDDEGKLKNKLDVIKEKLNIKSSVRLKVKSNGLNFKELRAMLNLKTKKYSDLTTDQLTLLRNKVLFCLENEIKFHISQWEERIRQIELVAKTKGIQLHK
jgi:hypothetical protein